jgi:hypothetical protein
MANPPPLPDTLDDLKDSDIDLLVEDWLERALRKAMPENVLSHLLHGHQSRPFEAEY